MRDLNVGDELDQYGLADLVARSGMASIFKAVDRETGATVVVKIPHVQYEADVVFFERFRREEEIGLRLDHPHIVKVLRPREKSRIYMVLEYVEGEQLFRLLQREKPLPVERALAIARQTCGALAYMHAHGVVHRDIKPDNVLVTAAGNVKIIDFGIATAEAARRLTWAGLAHALGTPDYMAPEQIRGRRGDARTDVYALGTMLYEMLTGSLPYASANTAALLRAKLAEPPKAPSYHVPNFDPSLEAILLRALEVAPRDRYASATALLQDLENPAAVAPRDPTTRRPPPPRIPRHVAVTIVLGALLAGLGSLVWLTHARSRAAVSGHDAAAPTAPGPQVTPQSAMARPPSAEAGTPGGR
jgi:serine/threonine-protein kinase